MRDAITCSDNMRTQQSPPYKLITSGGGISTTEYAWLRGNKLRTSALIPSWRIPYAKGRGDFILNSIFLLLVTSRGHMLGPCAYSSESHYMDFLLVMVELISTVEMHDGGELNTET
jgi:hypothetical protein